MNLHAVWLGVRCCRSVDMIGDGDEILNFQCLSPRVGVNAHIAKISIREGVFEIVAGSSFVERTPAG